MAAVYKVFSKEGEKIERRTFYICSSGQSDFSSFMHAPHNLMKESYPGIPGLREERKRERNGRASVSAERTPACSRGVCGQVIIIVRLGFREGISRSHSRPSVFRNPHMTTVCETTVGRDIVRAHRGMKIFTRGGRILRIARASFAEEFSR